MTKWIHKILSNPGYHPVAENRKGQRKIGHQCQNVKPLPSQVAEGAIRGMEPVAGRPLFPQPASQPAQLRLRDAGFIYAVHAVYEKEKQW